MFSIRSDPYILSWVKYDPLQHLAELTSKVAEKKQNKNILWCQNLLKCILDSSMCRRNGK